MEALVHNFVRKEVEVGSVTLTRADTGIFSINGINIPENAVEYLVFNGLKQSLADTYAGAKTHDEALGAWNGKLDRIISGELRAASGGGSRAPKVDNETKAMLLTGEFILKQDKFIAQWKALPKAKDDKEGRDKLIMEAYERYANVPAVAAYYEKQLAALEAPAIDFDIPIEL